MSVLKQVVTEKRAALARRKSRGYLQDIRSKVSDADPTRGFGASISKPGRLPNLIAEVKKASPSKGIIREDFHPIEIAQTYENGGAAALSVLTEERFFLGDPAYLRDIRAKVTLPLLQKDFIVDEMQMYEARAWGADAILLIAAILEPNQIKDYFDLARDLSLDVLVEIHSEKELERVIEWAPVIGINNRDLSTFETTIETTFRLLPEIPVDRIVVSESGIRRHEELERLSEAGVRAVLIGETFMAAENIAEKMKALFGEV
ncbi:MAG: indole-3-glycerol phosphate synthase TrpC [Nitrospiria bacterium]